MPYNYIPSMKQWKKTETNMLTIQHHEEWFSYKWKTKTLWNVDEKLPKVSQ